ncbi:outer membrane protein assembly factor BamA [Thermodesulfobacteriota bacterium]
MISLIFPSFLHLFRRIRPKTIVTLLFISLFLLIFTGESFADNSSASKIFTSKKFANKKFHGKEISKINIDTEPFINEDEMRWLAGIEAGDTYSDELIDKSIRMIFHKNFFSDIIVSAKEVSNKVELTFKLIPKVRLDIIAFVGNDNFWDSELKQAIGIKSGAELYSKDIDRSVKNLLRFYENEGYNNTSLSYAITPTKSEYKKKIVYNLDEGKHAAIKSLSFYFPGAKLDADKIKSVTDLSIGSRFSKKMVKQQIKEIEKYLIKNRYYDIKKISFEFKAAEKADKKFFGYKYAENINLYITIDVSEKVKINMIGNKKYSDKKILSFFNFSKHKSSDKKVIASFVEEVENFYRENGFYFVKINPAYPPGKVNGNGEKVDEKVINIHIYEGKPLEIRRVNFYGNDAYYDEELIEQMLTRAPGTFFKEYFVKSILDEDVKALEYLYRKDGYLDVNIQYDTYHSDDKREVTIDVRISEGEQTIISDIIIRGVSDEYIDDVKKIIKSKKGQEINTYQLEKDKISLKRFYEGNGHYKVKVEDKRELLPDNEIKVQYIVEEGIKAQIGKVIISNNDFTKKKVIRREAELNSGDPYIKNENLRAKQRVHRLGFFKDVKVDSISPEDEEKKDIVIKVDEKNNGAFEFGIGYATEERLRGFVELSHENLGGYGRSASIRAYSDSKSQKLTFALEEPWLFNNPYDASLIISDQYLNAESYTLRKFTTALAISKDYTEAIKAVLQYEVEFDELYNVEDEAVAIPEDVGTNRIHTISPFIVRDTRDDPFNPATGSLNSIKYDYAGPEIGSQLRFQKVTGRSSRYIPLRRNLILALSLRGGYGFSFGTAPELPINKRFFLGGRNTVRGFAPDEIGPKGKSDVPIGGNVMVNYNAEFRIAFSKSWGGIIFYDAGNVFAKSSDFIVTDIRDAAGVGLRYITVAGPISLDLGRKLDREPDEPLTEWYFTIGNIF